MRSIYEDGTVDCESARQGWQLREKVSMIAYDPVRKVDIYMPQLLTEKQLAIWRGAYWARKVADQHVRERNRSSRFPPGSCVTVACGGAWLPLALPTDAADGKGRASKSRDRKFLPADACWEGVVVAVNWDRTYSVQGNNMHYHDVAEERLQLCEEAQFFGKSGLVAGFPLRLRTRLQNLRSSRLAQPESGDAAVQIALGGKKSSSGYNALHYACAESTIEVVRKLLMLRTNSTHSKGSSKANKRTSGKETGDETTDEGEGYVYDINQPDGCGNTPLHWAASAGRLDVVKLLLLKKHERQWDQEADATLRNYMDLTPLQWTSKRNRYIIAKYALLQATQVKMDKAETAMDKELSEHQRKIANTVRHGMEAIGEAVSVGLFFFAFLPLTFERVCFLCRLWIRSIHTK